MGKSSRRAARSPRSTATGDVPAATGDVPAVGQREPCPCGSGKKYKHCHGRVRDQQVEVFVPRPFEGLPGEVDWVALREVVPAATARVSVAAGARRPAVGEDAGVREVTIATVLPLAWPALRRADGEVFVGLQTGGGSGDASRDAGAAMRAALDAAPGTPVTLSDLDVGAPLERPRLQDLVDGDAALTVTVHEGFDFWVEGGDDLDPAVRDSLEQANAAVIPTARLDSVEAAYWCRIGDRTHLRWVLPQPEDALLDALARLHAAGASGFGVGSRYVGAFRAHGLLVPVWDLPVDATAADVEEPAVAFWARLAEALAVDVPLTYDERRARAGVVSRQLTLR